MGNVLLVIALVVLVFTLVAVLVSLGVLIYQQNQWKRDIMELNSKKIQENSERIKKNKEFMEETRREMLARFERNKR